MTTWTKTAISAALCILGSCNRTPAQQQSIETQAAAARVGLVPALTPERFTVQLVQIVVDDIAYGGRRGMYLIVDNETGAEYVGLSGVGISELGSHLMSAGKTQRSVRDER